MKHKLVLGICLLALVIFYVLQKNVLGVFDQFAWSKDQVFIVKKAVRFLINDFLMIGVIYGIFNKGDYVKIAFIVQVFGLIFLFTPYLLIKFYISNSGHLISFLHRLVLNPLLMILLIPAFFYQEKLYKKHE